MGVVFTALFALGVVLLEQSDTRDVHFDVEHALYGNLESLVWLSGMDAESLFDRAALADLPPQLGRLALALLVVVVFLVVFWRQLVVSTFDPVFAHAAGVSRSLYRRRPDFAGRSGCGDGIRSRGGPSSPSRCSSARPRRHG